MTEEKVLLKVSACIFGFGLKALSFLIRRDVAKKVNMLPRRLRQSEIYTEQPSKANS